MSLPRLAADTRKWFSIGRWIPRRTLWTMSHPVNGHRSPRNVLPRGPKRLRRIDPLLRVSLAQQTIPQRCPGCYEPEYARPSRRTTLPRHDWIFGRRGDAESRDAVGTQFNAHDCLHVSLGLHTRGESCVKHFCSVLFVRIRFVHKTDVFYCFGAPLDRCTTILVQTAASKPKARAQNEWNEKLQRVMSKDGQCKSVKASRNESTPRAAAFEQLRAGPAVLGWDPAAFVHADEKTTKRHTVSVDPSMFDFPLEARIFFVCFWVMDKVSKNKLRIRTHQIRVGSASWWLTHPGLFVRGRCRAKGVATTRS